MSPISQSGRWFNSPEAASRAELASAVRTTTGTSAEFPTEDAEALLATIVVTAASGTSPTLDARLETSVGDDWFTVASFPQQTAANGNGIGRAFAPLGENCRWAWTIAGTSPSFTFRIDTTADREN